MRRAQLVALTLAAAIVGATVYALLTRPPRQPHGGPYLRAALVVCDLLNDDRCFQDGSRVQRPRPSGDCWRDPDGGQSYLWEPIESTGPGREVFLCTPVE